MAEILKQTPKILLVSNQRSTGPLWVMSLEQQLHVQVIFEPKPTHTIKRWAEEIPDLILLDLNLDETTQLELIKHYRFETSIPILLFTSNPTEEFLVEAYLAGVDECILKPVGTSLFHAKIMVWLRRSGNVPTETLDPLRPGNFQLLPAERILLLENGERVRLTNLELRLLYCLMSQPGRTVSSENLVQRVWGSHFEADNTVLKNIVYRLRKKIEIQPARPQIIQTVVGVGYRFAA